VNYCENSTGSLYLSASGELIRWYSDASKTQLIDAQNYLTVPQSDRTYYVTQTIGGCESIPSPVVVSKVIIDTEVYTAGNTLIVKEEQGDTYAWYKNGFYLPNSNSQTIPYFGETGVYSVFITKGNCYKVSADYNMPGGGLVTAIESESEAGWSVYPNPNAGTFMIEVMIPQGTVNIYEVTGRLVYTMPVDQNVVIDKSRIALNKGIYLVTLNDGKQVRSKRVVIN
jgi:hypothetical protein